MTDDFLARISSILGSAYVVERELAAGMSRVVVARETALGRRVVVKVLPAKWAAGMDASRFRREVVMACTTQPFAPPMRYLALLLLTTCASSAKPGNSAAVPPPSSSNSAVAANTRYTRADVDFMSGMIGHHAQAIVMARLVISNEASPGVRLLAERISVSQQDEIDYMSAWLRKRNEKVPAANTNLSAEHFHHGPDHVMMPGMLTPEQMDSLSRARGADFGKLFLTFMIQHHRGALTMVQKLFASPGAGQDGEIFRFASDVEADQRTEIARMQSMLNALQKRND